MNKEGISSCTYIYIYTNMCYPPPGPAFRYSENCRNPKNQKNPTNKKKSKMARTMVLDFCKFQNSIKIKKHLMGLEFLEARNPRTKDHGSGRFGVLGIFGNLDFPKMQDHGPGHLGIFKISEFLEL